MFIVIYSPFRQFLLMLACILFAGCSEKQASFQLEGTTSVTEAGKDQDKQVGGMPRPKALDGIVNAWKIDTHAERMPHDLSMQEKTQASMDSVQDEVAQSARQPAQQMPIHVFPATNNNPEGRPGDKVGPRAGDLIH